MELCSSTNEDLQGRLKGNLPFNSPEPYCLQGWHCVQTSLLFPFALIVLVSVALSCTRRVSGDEVVVQCSFAVSALPNVFAGNCVAVVRCKCDPVVILEHMPTQSAAGCRLSAGSDSCCSG